MRVGKERSAIGEKISLPGPRPPRRAAILLLGCLFAFGSLTRAQDTGPTEYQIKAAFL